MGYRVTHSLLMLFFILTGGCASIQEAEKQAAVANPNTACDLTVDELQTVRAKALDFLIEKWPVLEKRCERISGSVVASPAAGCLIMGGPIIDESCEPPSHVAYSIVFVRETLEPNKIYWLTN